MDLLDKKLENCIRERVDEPRELYKKKAEFIQNVKGLKRQFTTHKENPEELDEEEQKALQKERAIQMSLQKFQESKDAAKVDKK